ncbi:hypothetical protein [Sphingobacterium sp.]|uniref:hypothetical protein n=1 Tax=Sphingobacterium sp. TaxID=341027 RepID=UPI002FDC809E
MGINDNGFIRGLVGPLVNRKVGNKNLLQSRPYRVKQTEDTKRAGKDFGNVSRAGALIRMCLSLIHQELHDGQMGNRLNRQLYRALKTNLDRPKGLRTLNTCALDRLVNFQFNENCHMHDYLFIDPVVSVNENNELNISFPEFESSSALVVHKKCNAIVFKFHAFAFDFEMSDFIEIKDTEWEYDIIHKEHTIPAKSLTIECADYAGKSIVVGFTILYLYKDSRRSTVLNEIDCNPASILAAFQA